MIEISIPGRGKLQCKYLVLDYNGTLAVDGRLIDGVKETLQYLSDNLEIHVLTADTFGKARSGLTGIDCKLSILPIDRQDIGKREYVTDLGAEFSVCIGNGRNDRLMLKEASLGIAVIQGERLRKHCWQPMWCAAVLFLPWNFSAIPCAWWRP